MIHYSDTVPSTEMLTEWHQWLAEEPRPPAVLAMAARFPPWRWYRLTPTGQACRVIAYSENHTIRVYAEHPELGPISGVEVFGIDPADLVPWNA